MPQFDEKKQNKRLAEIRHKEEEVLIQQMAQKYGLTYIDLSGTGIDTDALKLIEEKEAREKEIALFKIVGKNLHMVAHSPERSMVQDVKKRLEDEGYHVTLYVGSTQSLEKAWNRYEDISMASTSRGSFLDLSEEALDNIASQVKTNEDVQRLFQKTDEETASHRISKLIEIIFGAAIALKASDIHIEPQEEEVRLRYREDGVLHDILFFDHDTYRMINSRIKLLSELMLTQTENAQDGRFTIDYKGKQIEIRTSVIPGGYGESIVMRLLNPDGINVGLEQLGIEPKLLSILKREVAKPNGLILTTGPTGSGKTTTLYSFLKYVYDPEIKILTIEDPIEYHLQGITQTQIDHEKGYDFLSGLRAALRQDPDLVMVGEIRDGETASIAVNAALTGHLVLSTLHTNNAAGAIPRLLDLGVNPSILSAALSVSIAQRLVRKLCPHCKKERDPSPEEEKLLRNILTQADDLGKDLQAYGISRDQEIKLYEAVGCDKCGNFGYKGRIGVYEAILNDESIQKILEKHPSEREVKRVASKQGILSMKEDGVMKILSGITSMEEVEKVVDLNEDIDLFFDKEGGVLSDKGESRNKEVLPGERSEMKETDTAHSTQHTGKEELIPKMQNADYGMPAENNVPSETDTAQNSSGNMRATEVQLLVDYLKMLEEEQRRSPELGLHKQMQAVQQTIMGLLKHGGAEGLFARGKTEEERIHDEVELLMKDLKKIEHHQAVSPDVGVADKLQKIRTTLENL